MPRKANFIDELLLQIVKGVGCRLQFVKPKIFCQVIAGRLTPVSDSIGDHLTAPSAQSNPDPRLARLLGDKGPQFVQFQNRCNGTGGIGRNQRLTQWRKLCCFF
jgi:hypothetical protein